MSIWLNEISIWFDDRMVDDNRISCRCTSGDIRIGVRGEERESRQMEKLSWNVTNADSDAKSPPINLRNSTISGPVFDQINAMLPTPPSTRFRSFCHSTFPISVCGFPFPVQICVRLAKTNEVGSSRRQGEIDVSFKLSDCPVECAECHKGRGRGKTHTHTQCTFNRPATLTMIPKIE